MLALADSNASSTISSEGKRMRQIKKSEPFKSFVAFEHKSHYQHTT